MTAAGSTARQGISRCRVLHVLKVYRPTFTGEGIFLERSSAVMHEIAPDVEHDLLVTHAPRPVGPRDASVCPTLARVTHLCPGPVGGLHREALLVWWLLRNLHRYDVVHFRTHADWYFLGYVLVRLARRRLVLSATLDDSVPGLARQYSPRLRPLAATLLARLFDAYVSISPKLLRETSSVADPRRCHLVPCGITIPVQQPGERTRLRHTLGIAPSHVLLLFVGGLCRRKDPAFLVRSFRRILARQPDARLVLVGPVLEPDYVRALERSVREQGLAGHVLLVGEQPDPHPYFDAADMLVFPSHLEGFGTVVPEAMGHSLPVVVRKLPGVNDDFVLEGRTGYLFEEEDGYVEAVCRLAADPALRRTIGRQGNALAAQRFGMRTAAARYLGIYGVWNGSPAQDGNPA